MPETNSYQKQNEPNGIEWSGRPNNGVTATAGEACSQKKGLTTFNSAMALLAYFLFESFNFISQKQHMHDTS